MAAEPIVRAKEVRDDGSVVEIVVWRLTQPLAPCTHPYKYRLYFGADGYCRVRYDNERGKGDHRHVTVLSSLTDLCRCRSCWTTSSTTLRTGGDP